VARAGTRNRDARRTEDAGVLLLLTLMGACLALVLERLVAARPPVLPLVPVAVLVGWVLSDRRIRLRWWLPAAALAGATAAIWLAGGQLRPGIPPLEQVLGMRSALLSDPLRILDASTPGGKVAGPLALVTLVWVAPLLAARACRLRRSAVHAWAPTGALLLSGMTVRGTDDLAPLVAFSASAMLLSVTTATGASRRRWQRHGITESEGVSVAMARRGWVATAATVTLAWALTSVAVGAPLEAAWRQVGEWWADRPLGVGPGQALFDRDFVIGGAFNPGRDIVAYVSGVSAPVYLRAVTHDTFTGNGWAQARGASHSFAPGEPVLPDGSLEWSDPRALGEPVEVEVRLERGGTTLLLPGQAVSVSVAGSASLSEAGPFLVSVAAASRLAAGESYVALTTLRHASGTDLAAAAAPDTSALAAYLGLENVSQRTVAEAERVTAGQSTAYERAVALVGYLRGAPFRYSARAARPQEGSGRDAVDYFLFDERGRSGFCEQFASAMVVMARSVGIPARLARGYAGGDRVAGGTYRVRGTEAHAWAELYFPGFGWQVFEATPSVPRVVRPGGRQPSTPPSSSVSPLPSAGASAPPRVDGEQGGPGMDDGPLLPAALAVVGVAAVALVLVAARRRRDLRRVPPRILSPTWLWSRLRRRAALAGLAPHPTETAYEFAGALERAVPEVGAEVRLLAEAYVLEMYSAPGRPTSRTGELAAAWRRVTARLRRHRIGGLLRRGRHG
jgi:transglutaminase-like putative cysteine protease